MALGGLMEGWMNGWVGGIAGLKIAYSNQKVISLGCTSGCIDKDVS